MSTAPPALMRKLAADLAAKGADFADAPIARTRAAAVDGTLSIMVGGSPEVFARIRPILETMGNETPPLILAPVPRKWNWKSPTVSS
jgi:3-hydroxyisobutyrate dehydrogenase-like beta-hydroxyacid dehydrogenase